MVSKFSEKMLLHEIGAMRSGKGLKTSWERFVVVLMLGLVLGVSDVFAQRNTDYKFNFDLKDSFMSLFSRENIGTLAWMTVGFVVVGILGVRRSQKIAKAEQARVSYINNLGFKPTRICATLHPAFKKERLMYSQANLDTISNTMAPLDKAKYLFKFYVPEFGVFMNAKQKVFAVRSYDSETVPTVYSFSQLQHFEVSQDVREGLRYAIHVSHFSILLGGGLKGTLSMRVVFSGINGPESVIIQPQWESGIKPRKLSINDHYYKLKLEELVNIADCLQWIHDHA